MIDIQFLGSTPFERLKILMARLRSPDGCPWDQQQTFKTIALYTIEEAYEVHQTIQDNDLTALKEELGDLLFQVIFHAQMASEENAFTLDEVCDGLTEKMIRRHPHVFGSASTRSIQEQTQNWEDMKAIERKQKSKNHSLLDDVPLALPALMRAEKLQKRAARVGFDWPDLTGVINKIYEEVEELKTAYEQGKSIDIEDEMGDLLFALTNLARKMKIDPEKALRRTNDKFTQRFQFIETMSKRHNKPINDMSLDEMERHWQAAKTQTL